MQVDIDVHTFRLRHNCKIDTACFEEGKRPAHPRELAPWLSRDAQTHRALLDQKKTFSCGLKTRPTIGSLAIPWLVRAHGGSIKVNNEARVLDGTHAERRGMDDTACSRNDRYGTTARHLHFSRGRNPPAGNVRS